MVRSPDTRTAPAQRSQHAHSWLACRRAHGNRLQCRTGSETRCILGEGCKLPPLAPLPATVAEIVEPASPAAFRSGQRSVRLFAPVSSAAITLEGFSTGTMANGALLDLLVDVFSVHHLHSRTQTHTHENEMAGRVGGGRVGGRGPVEPTVLSTQSATLPENLTAKRFPCTANRKKKSFRR